MSTKLRSLVALSVVCTCALRSVRMACITKFYYGENSMLNISTVAATSHERHTSEIRDGEREKAMDYVHVDVLATT